MNMVPQNKETQVARTREEANALKPLMDIFEMEDGLGVVVDLPGVQKEGVDVRVENDILTITGKTDSPVKGNPLYREFELGNYFRQFQLTDHVDQEKIKAEMKNGVLTIHLPKAEKAKPKRIAVSVAS